MSVAEENAQQIRQWKQQGKTTAVLFGRFQPLHFGHKALIEQMIKSGLDVHIFMNNKVNTPNEKNPYSAELRRRMFAVDLPDIPQDHLHEVEGVYLGNGGDVGEDIRKLKAEFGKVAPAEETVIFYARKNEDVKDYLVDGKEYKNVHYVDLLGMPPNPYQPQLITSELTGTDCNASARNIRNDPTTFGDMITTRVGVLARALPDRSHLKRDYLKGDEQTPQR